MASASFQSSYVELWGQPEVTKPEPLRIVKERPNTIAGCSASRAIPIPRRGSCGYPDTCASSPEGPTRPLTIYKRRRPRGSVLDRTLDWNSCETPVSLEGKQDADFNNFPDENSAVIFKGGQSDARTATLSSFHNSELFRGSSQSEVDSCSPQFVKAHLSGCKDASNPLDIKLFPSFNLTDPSLNLKAYSNQPQRRRSIGKKLISKAFDGLGNARSKSVHFLRSKYSKDSLFRQVSLRNFDSSGTVSSEASHSSSSRFSFEQESVPVCTRSKPIMPADTPSIALTPSFILYPEIIVIPEVDSVDAGDDPSIWVAVAVTGVLQKTAGCDRISDTLLEFENSGQNQDGTTSENADYGHLYGVNIRLAARKGCILESVVEEENQPKCLRLGQTELILAKLKLLPGKRNSSHVRESSEELIAELESQLGNTTTEYLAVRISYKHSALPTSRSSTAAFKGLSYHATTIKIEAHAAIKRHCSKSSWGHQRSAKSDSSSVPNPIFSLINAHCDPIKAANLINKIATDPVSRDEVHWREIDSHRHCNSSSDTVVSLKWKPSRDVIRKTTQQQDSVSIPVPEKPVDIDEAEFHGTDCNLGVPAWNLCNDPDPARKIWAEMRKTSRGTGIRPSRPTGSLEFGMNGRSNGNSDVEADMEIEQARIMELALRNKRSLGADTLRSMATPSISMGLGMGRSWRLGPPWW